MDWGAFLSQHNGLTLTPGIISLIGLVYRIERRVFRLEILQGIRDESGVRIPRDPPIAQLEAP